jgi:prepilin-type N-terminal cleavage/methylation domain-containing protein
MTYLDAIIPVKRRFMKRSLPSAPPSGFTLIEVLVVIVMVGALAAIAAPSWLAFLNNQRVGTTRSQIADTIRKAQDQAKQTKRPQAIVFDNNGNRPRMGIVAVVGTNVSPVSNWTPIGNTDIPANTLQLSTRNGFGTGGITTTAIAAIAFDENGTVIKTDGASIRDLPIPAAIIIKPVNSAEPKRCIVVRTILGAMSEGASSQCDSL